MNKTLIFTLIASICFGLWPMVAQKSSASEGWITIIISTTTLIGISLFFLYNKTYKEVLSLNDLFFLVIAGAINVLGWIAYQYVFGSAPKAEFSKYIMILGIAIPFFAGLSGLFILKESFSLNKLIGLFLGIISIYFLNK